MAQALIEIIAVFHQIALLGKGKSILFCLQMEHYGAEMISHYDYLVVTSGWFWTGTKSRLRFVMVSPI
jgi:hypothetical protein